MAGIMEKLRRFSGRAGEGAEAQSPVSEGPSPKSNPWRGVFDPNSNPNMDKAGRSAYDIPDPSKPAKTIQDYHLDANKAAASDLTEAAFTSMGAQSELCPKSSSDTLDAASLRKMFDAARVEKIMEAADKNKDGKISFNEFCSMLRSSPCK